MTILSRECRDSPWISWSQALWLRFRSSCGEILAADPAHVDALWSHGHHHRPLDELAHVNDFKFERMLMLYGVSTGTLSTGLALLRVMDPEFKTKVSSDICFPRD